MEPVTVYLGLGSNLGEREANIRRALNLLSQKLRLGLVSSLYDTEPVGVVNQPRFLNLVCQVFTNLPPLELLTITRGLELKMGRVTGKPGASRIIDIDILFYGNRVVDMPGLVIPHPRLAERAFVLVPLAEIAPELVYPVNGKTIKELLLGLKETQDVIKWEGK